MNAFSKLACTAVAALALCATGAAFAQAPNNPVGLWNFQAYADNSANLFAMGNQNICFLANGTWYGTTFPNWNGRWFQKGNNVAGNGDRVRIVGNWAFGAGNDSAEISFINLSLMTGGWHEWTDGFGVVLWIQITGRKIGTNCPPPASLEFEATADEAQRRPWEEKGAQEPVCSPNGTP
jgi:hypothetical protein